MMTYIYKYKQMTNAEVSSQRKNMCPQTYHVNYKGLVNILPLALRDN